MAAHVEGAYENCLQFKRNFEVWTHLQDTPDTFTTKAYELGIMCHFKDRECALNQWKTSNLAVVADLITNMRERKRVWKLILKT